MQVEVRKTGKGKTQKRFLVITVQLPSDGEALKVSSTGKTRTVVSASLKQILASAGIEVNGDQLNGNLNLWIPN